MKIILFILLLICIAGSVYFAIKGNEKNLIAWMAGVSFGNFIVSEIIFLLKKSTDD